MTEPPAGWSAPDPERRDAPVGYGAPTGYPPPPGYGAPFGWSGSPYGAPVVTPGVIPLRPLTIGELLDGAVKVVRRYPRPTLGLSAMVSVVTTATTLAGLLVSGLPSLSSLNTTTSSADGTTAGPSALSASLSVVNGLVGALAGLALTGCLVTVVGKAVLGRPISLSEVWVQVRPRLLALVGVALLTFLISATPLVGAVVLLIVLLAVGGPITLLVGIPVLVAAVVFAPYVYIRLSLAPAALMLERLGVRAALRRSGELVKGSWWRVLWVLLLASVITAVLSGVLLVPVGVITGVAAFSAAGTQHVAVALLVLYAVMNGVVRTLVEPFAAGVQALLYVDRRMRAEGLDLTLQAAATT